MKIVIAPDSFKESLSALEVANEIEAGFKHRLPDAEYLKVPVADGGEGTVQSMVDATNGHLVELEVCGPLGQAVKAHYGILGTEGGTSGIRTAVIEMAAASGLHHVSPAFRNPRLTTSYGTGELIVDAWNVAFATSSSALAAVPPMMAAPVWPRRWAPNYWIVQGWK